MYATPGQPLLQDPALLQVYSALRSVQAVDASFEAKIRIPILVVLGAQSSGKTSFIEALIGFPVGFTDRGTATRCPVRYVLRSGAQVAYSVGGVPVCARHEVRVAVREHMRSLGRGFSLRALVVEIQEPAMVDIDITDLPGLKDRAEADFGELAGIARAFLQGPSVVPVVLCQASKSHETQHDLDALREVGLETSRALVVVNYWNKQIRDLPTVSAVNEYCRGHQRKFPNVRFVMLHYRDGIDKDRMGFERLSEYYSTLPEEEGRAIEEALAAMEGDVALDPLVRENMGVQSAFDHMQALLHEWVRRNSVEALAALQDRQGLLRAERAKLQEAMADQDPRRVAQQWRDYALDYGRVMAAMHSARLEHVAAPSRDSPFAPRYRWAFSMDDLEVARTFEEELELLGGAEPPPGWLSTAELRSELPGTHTGAMLDEALSAHAAFDRLLHVASYLMMRYPMRPFTKAEIYSKAGHSRSGLLHSLNKHAVVKDLVTERLFDLQGIMARTMQHIRCLYEAQRHKVHEVLSENYPAVRHHRGFLERLDGKFSELLLEALRSTNALLQDVVEERTRCFGVDLPNRLTALLAMAPLREDILVEQPAPFEHEGSVPGAAAAAADAGRLSGARALEELAGAASDLARGGPARCWTRRASESQLLGTPDVLQRAENEDAPERVRQQRASTIAVKQVLHQHREAFRFIDFVEGGLMDLAPDEYRCLNVEELNRTGEQYFHLLKGLIVLEFEAKLNKHVYEPLENRLLPDLTKQVLRLVDELEADSDEIQRIVEGSSARALEEALKSADRQLELVEGALEKLHDVRAGRAPLVGQGSARSRVLEPPVQCSEAVVEGELCLPRMELSVLPGNFRRALQEAARKDVASLFKHPLRKTRVTGLGSSTTVVKYRLEAEGAEDLAQVRRTVACALSRPVHLPRAAEVYCKATGAPGGPRALAIGLVQPPLQNGAAEPAVEQPQSQPPTSSGARREAPAGPEQAPPELTAESAVGEAVAMPSTQDKAQVEADVAPEAGSSNAVPMREGAAEPLGADA